MRHLPPMSAVIAFEAAARHVSFLAAAQELHLTPSAVSHQVKNLEIWCGRRLFVRYPRRLLLTEDGRRLLQDLGPALDVIHAAFGAMRPVDRRSHLAVHCSPSFAAKWLGPRLPRFMTAHPSPAIRLSSGPEPVDLAKHPAIDVHIAYGHTPDGPGIVVEDLGLEDTVPLCSPQLLAQVGSVTPEALRELVLIESSLNPVRWPDWARLHGVRLQDRPRPAFDRGSLAIAAAVDGLGVALETLRFAESELAKGELVALKGQGFEAVSRPLHYLCYRESDLANPALRVFVGWLKHQLGLA